MELHKLKIFRKKYTMELAYMQVLSYLCGNNTCHASRQISAPGQVFDFIGLVDIKIHTV